MPDSLEEEPKRRQVAWIATWFALVIDIVVLSSVWIYFYLDGDHIVEERTFENSPSSAQVQGRSYSSPIGWTAAAAAAIIFGTSELPIKIPKSQDIGPAWFNTYTFLGNGVCHSLFMLPLLIAGKTLEWKWEAVGAALNIMMVQAFARSAIWLLGISIAPPMWCAVGMSTSFAWGTTVFGDRPRNLVFSLFGLFMLMAGIGGVSSASVLSNRSAREAEKQGAQICPMHDTLGQAATTEDVALTSVVGCSIEECNDVLEVEDPPPRQSSSIVDNKLDDIPSAGQRKMSHWSALLRGSMYALGAGVADGSLVAFYQQAEQNSRAHNASEAELFYAIFNYLGTFGLVMLLSSMLLFSVLSVMRRIGKVAGATSCSLETVAPGMISGSMWAGANSCSVLASHFLGMALSFPLTQTASVICALLGLLVFGELQGATAKSVFSGALVIVTLGAVFLAAFGKPAAALDQV